ncbi:MAG: ribosomal RNA small subunit methyltransferase A [Candidatus Kerfeldbacteria bacterium]|nr:ribosomal RNA small subunit methyltransferase A [Candidatus Kerfeldbacteria bacterium]
MTRPEVIRMLKSIGLRPDKAAGQNFLLDEKVVAMMVKTAAVKEGDTVLEIGPGLGVLTAALLDCGAKVIAVELDQRLFGYLRQRFAHRRRLTLVHGDIFRIRLGDYVRDRQYKVVANLPYSGTALFFRNFLAIPPRPSDMTVMIQRDVARRIVAQPGEHSLLSLLVQSSCIPTIVADIPPSSFYPSPQVYSSVLLCPHVSTSLIEEQPQLWRKIRAGFSSRRKQLHNALAAGLDRSHADILRAMVAAGLNPAIRAQDLTVKNWLELEKTLR